MANQSKGWTGIRITWLCLAIWISVIEILGFCMFLKSSYKILKAKHWPSTSGQIVNTQMKYISAGGGRGGSYLPEIEYKYSVRETEYFSNTYSYIRPLFARNITARKYIAEFPERSETTVYYNPHHPEDSVLINSLGRFRLGLATRAVAIAFFGCLIYPMNKD